MEKGQQLTGGFVGKRVQIKRQLNVRHTYVPSFAIDSTVRLGYIQIIRERECW